MISPPISGETAALYAAVGFLLFLAVLIYRWRSDPMSVAVVIVIAGLTVTYVMRYLEASGRYIVDPDFYAYSRFIAGTGAWLGFLTVVVVAYQRRWPQR